MNSLALIIIGQCITFAIQWILQVKIYCLNKLVDVTKIVVVVNYSYRYGSYLNRNEKHTQNGRNKWN